MFYGFPQFNVSRLMYSLGAPLRSPDKALVSIFAAIFLTAAVACSGLTACLASVVSSPGSSGKPEGYVTRTEVEYGFTVLLPEVSRLTRRNPTREIVAVCRMLGTDGKPHEISISMGRATVARKMTPDSYIDLFIKSIRLALGHADKKDMGKCILAGAEGKCARITAGKPTSLWGLMYVSIADGNGYRLVFTSEEDCLDDLMDQIKIIVSSFQPI